MDGGEDKSSIKHGWKKEGGREEEVVIYIYIYYFFSSLCEWEAITNSGEETFL